MRIPGGASLPDGTDAVALRDDVAVVGSSMAIGKSIPAGNNVRPAGEDVAKGDPVMEEGQRIRGMDVGVLAALGRSRALVRPRPRVVTFSAAEPGEGSGGSSSKESNSFTVAGMAREAGSEPTRGGIVAPELDVLHEKFQSYLPQADAFITAGGVTGDEGGPIRQVADKLGGIDLWTIVSAGHDDRLRGDPVQAALRAAGESGRGDDRVRAVLPSGAAEDGRAAHRATS